MVRGVIPFLPPISINQRMGARYKDSELKRWEGKAALIVGSAAREFEDLAEYYQIVICWWGSNHDIDAFLKTILDLVTRKIGVDDSRVLRIELEKLTENPYDSENPLDDIIKEVFEEHLEEGVYFEFYEFIPGA